MTLPENQIVQGDCVQILKTLPDAVIDLVVTDPPYLVNYRDRSGRTVRNDSGNPAFLTAFSDLYRVLKPNSFCVCFYGWKRVDEFFGAWRRAGFRPVGHIVWQKVILPVRAFSNIAMSRLICWRKAIPDAPQSR